MSPESLAKARMRAVCGENIPQAMQADTTAELEAVS
jgi:hypothetical protein